MRRGCGRAVRFAARQGLHPAIRAGGHNAAALAMVDDDLLVSLWENASDDAAQTTWTRGFYEAMQPWSAAMVYVNTLSEDDRGRVAEAYGTNYRRLPEIKAKYDPDNRFRRNQNTLPSRATSSPSLPSRFEQEAPRTV